jgi:L-asparaginase II
MEVRFLRGGVVEAVHLVAAVALDLEGRVLLQTGPTDRPFWYRSASKPFQAAVVQDSGADLDDERLAVAAASHDADPVHVALVESMLHEVGLTEEHLRCPAAWPRSDTARRLVHSAGADQPRRVWHNCSGKHAAMLRACVASGWDTETYMRPEHPLQRRIAQEMENVAPLRGGVDGCGVPVFGGDCLDLARAYRELVTDPRLGSVTRAMSRFPALVSGVGNADAVVACWLHAVAKRGAAGCLGVGLFELGSVAVKVWDGDGTAVGPAVLEVLNRLSWIPTGIGDRLGAELTPRIVGGDAEVGSVRVIFDPP